MRQINKTEWQARYRATGSGRGSDRLVHQTRSESTGGTSQLNLSLCAYWRLGVEMNVEYCQPEIPTEPGCQNCGCRAVFTAVASGRQGDTVYLRCCQCGRKRQDLAVPDARVGEGANPPACNSVQWCAATVAILAYVAM